MIKTSQLATASALALVLMHQPAGAQDKNSAETSKGAQHVSEQKAKEAHSLRQQNEKERAAQRQAEQSQQKQGEPPVILISDWNYDSIYSEGWSGRQLMDTATVYGPDGDDIGSVENLIVGGDGRLLGIIAQVGGFLDIGDTHVFVPWDQVELSDDLERVSIPVTDETVEEYSTWADGYLRKADTGTRQVVRSDLATGPRAWKATELLGDDAFLTNNMGYGKINDLIFTSDGKLHAVVVNAFAGHRGGYRAFPFYGYGYGWEPGYPAYYLGYSQDDVARIPEFDYEKMNRNVASQDGDDEETTGSDERQQKRPAGEN